MSTTTATDLVDLTATELLAGYASAAFTPLEVLDAVRARTDRLQPELNAFVHRDPERARAQAAEATARWAAGQPRDGLDGVPLTLKENIAVTGLPITLGTAALAGAPAQTVDGPVAMTTDAAGAVRLGTTTMPDYGILSASLSSLHGITRNPWDRRWTAGGSSSGAAAAAAARLGPLHVGSDIGGSVRLPAGWTGLATLKPTHGLVPVDPPYLGRAVGPLARTVDDVALAMGVLTRPDPLDRDHTWTPGPPQSWGGRATDAEIVGLRVAVHTDAGAGMPVDPQVAAVVDAVAETFARAGATVRRIEPFVTPELLHGVDRFFQARTWSDLRALPVTGRAAVLPYVQQWCLAAADLSGVEVLAAYHTVQRLRAVTAAVTRPYDVVLSPVAPVAAFPVERHSPRDDPETGMAHIAFTVPYNVADQPAATVNAGFTTDGRPIGVQLAGHRFTDAALLRTAGWYERARPHHAVPVWPWGRDRD